MCGVCVADPKTEFELADAKHKVLRPAAHLPVLPRMIAAASAPVAPPPAPVAPPLAPVALGRPPMRALPLAAAVRLTKEEAAMMIALGRVLVRALPLA